MKAQGIAQLNNRVLKPFTVPVVAYLMGGRQPNGICEKTSVPHWLNDVNAAFRHLKPFSWPCSAPS